MSQSYYATEVGDSGVLISIFRNEYACQPQCQPQSYHEELVGCDTVVTHSLIPKPCSRCRLGLETQGHQLTASSS